MLSYRQQQTFSSQETDKNFVVTSLPFILSCHSSHKLNSLQIYILARIHSSSVRVCALTTSICHVRVPRVDTAGILFIVTSSDRRATEASNSQYLDAHSQPRMRARTLHHVTNRNQLRQQHNYPRVNKQEARVHDKVHATFL